jgi:ferredoxin
VPVLAGRRDERYPPLILGGSNAMAAQALIAPSGDAVVDALFFGEGEERIAPLVRALCATEPAHKRARLARAAAQLDGLWIAGLSRAQTVTQAVLERPEARHLLVDYPSLNGPEAGTARLQINYGCPAFCSFCFEGYERKPYRELDLENILRAAYRIKQRQGAETLELYSFNFNTHAAILTLLPELNRLFDGVRVMSQRVDLLHHTPGLLEAEVAADKRSFTLGVEGVSARLRAWLHKSLETEAIRAVVERLFQQKIRQIKLFYLLTGHEDEADLAEFRAFVRQLKALRRQHNPGIRVTFSFGYLVRLPFTPLRHDRLFLDPEHWRGIAGPLKSACETNGFEFRLATDWDEYCTTQVLALGGRWLHQPVVALAERGHCYDAGLPSDYWDALRGWIVEHGHWNAAFLGEKGPDYTFPLPFVRPRVDPDFLYRQYRQAQACVDAGYCLGDHCLRCGACADEDQRRAITTHAIERPKDPGYLTRLRDLMRDKWRLEPLYVRARLPAVVAGTDPAWMNAWAMRRLLAAYPALANLLLSARESVFSVGENQERYANVYGETVLALRAWDAEWLAEVLAAPPESAPEDGLELLGPAPDFEPGVFERARLTLRLPTAHFPRAGRTLIEFLRAAYVPCNVRRQGGGYILDLPAKALKKRIVFAGRYREGPEETTVELTVSPKFDLLGYLRAFPESDRHRQARIEVTELAW